MKILRMFDSLKFVRAMFVAIACSFILNVAHADTTAIQSVIAYGKTEQNGTPTPTAPVPIMTNNGELTVAKNLFNQNEVLAGYFSSALGSEIQARSTSRTFVIPCKPNTTYTFYFDNSMLETTPRCSISGFEEKPEIGGATTVQSLYTDNYSKIHNVTFTTGANVHYLALWLIYNSSHAGVQDALKTVVLREGTSTDGIYTNGLTETIRDAAGHKATTQMLLSVGDYKDEQNITTGAITRKVGVKVLDGTELWSYYSVQQGNMFRTTIADTVQDDKGVLEVLCNSYEVVSYSQRTNGTLSGTSRNYDFINNNYTTLADWKQYLAEQYAAGTPVIVVYPLATETTENVATQSLTTAPVRQTLGAIMNMPIKTILTDNTEIMSGAEELIKIATTKYNEESFTDVQDALTGVFDAVDTVVTQTMNQAQQIDQIATNKQTRPDETCPVGKNCLLVEDEQGVPHWYVIAGADEANPSTNP